MAQLDQPFDSSKVDPNAGFPVYPAGGYAMQAVRSEWKPTKDGKALYLEIELVFLDGSDRRYTERLNLKHAKPNVVEIANKQLSGMHRATLGGNTGVLTDSEQLHHKPIWVELSVSPRRDADGKPLDGQFQNNAVYKPINAAKNGPLGGTATASPAAPATGATPAPAQAAAAVGAAPGGGPKKKPWDK